MYSRFANDPVSEWANVISSADRLLYGWGKKPEAVWHSVKGYPKHPNPQFPVKWAEWLEEMGGIERDRLIISNHIIVHLRLDFG